MTFTLQLFSNERAQVEIVIIKYQHRVSNGCPGIDVFWRQHVGLIGSPDWLPVADTDTIGTPTRAGRHHHVIKSVFKDVLRAEVTVEKYLYIGHLLNPPDAPIASSCPGAQAGQATLLCHSATRLPPCLGKRHSVPPLTKRPCCLKTRRPSTDHQHCGI